MVLDTNPRVLLLGPTKAPPSFPGQMAISDANAPVNDDLQIVYPNRGRRVSAFTINGTPPVSSVGAEEGPAALRLSAAFPNPFNPVTTIGFELPQEQHVQLSIFGVDGRLVKTLVSEARPAGSRQVFWTGVDDGGRAVASGTYIYRLEAGGTRLQRAMTLIK